MSGNYPIEDFNEAIEKFLESRLFVDEVIRDNLVLPKGTIITEGYQVILPDGMTKTDLISQ